ncbi:amino acid permease-domain-containing protein [Tricladium varicosporioides]|nr:amino acid permease-domain-containing protein [Hymenoscyphus varicosporioides]
MASPIDSGSNPSLAVENESEFDMEWSPDLDPDDLRELQAAQQDPSKIISSLPRESARLGYYSTVCLIFNRMIGTGIFNSASIVFTNTQSIGLSLLLWAFGAILALAGVIVYIELGLTIPRWPFGPNGEKISTPRSGDAKNYKPVFLATCLFGITFIILENTAPNSVSFAQNVLDACHAKQTPGKIIAIALAANTFACLLHAMSRKWGMILNNVFGTVKFFILIFILIIGFIWIDRDVANTNFDIKTSFSTENSPKLPYRYAEAFMFVLFPYTAFHQINYVISELDQPRKTFPRASWYGVLTVAILYTAVNMIYAAIIPKKELFTPGGIDVGTRFFQLTLGRVVTSRTQLQTIFSILKAISAIGNIIVVTFTAARVKQEIAKEGVLPYSLVFAQNYDFSLGRFLRKTSPKAHVNPAYSEKTPVATIALHWSLTTAMVLAGVLAIQPKPYSPTPAFSFLTSVFVYNIDVLCFTSLAFGVLCLRFSRSARWANKSEFKHPAVSILAALTLFVGCLFPLIFIWVPDPAFKTLTRTSNLVPWYAGQTTGLCLVAFSFLYWVGFRTYISIRSAREGKTLHVKREPKFKHDSGGLTQILEIVTLQWRREVGMRLDEIEEAGNEFRPEVAPPAPDSITTLRRYAAAEQGGSTLELERPAIYENMQRQSVVRRKPVAYELPVL